LPSSAEDIAADIAAQISASGTLRDVIATRLREEFAAAVQDHVQEIRSRLWPDD